MFLSQCPLMQRLHGKQEERAKDEAVLGWPLTCSDPLYKACAPPRLLSLAPLFHKQLPQLSFVVVTTSSAMNPTRALSVTKNAMNTTRPLSFRKSTTATHASVLAPRHRRTQAILPRRLLSAYDKLAADGPLGH